MKALLQRVFLPILRFFEEGEGVYHYQKSHRLILIVVGLLFFLLASVVVFLAPDSAGLGGFIPVLVFFTASLVCLVVGCLGSERAVAKIWGRVEDQS